MSWAKLLLAVLLVSGCNHVRVKTHHGWMGPDSFEATDGKVSVYYYNGNCCCVAKEVLKKLAADANDKKFDWKLMADDEYKKRMLRETCVLLGGN